MQSVLKRALIGRVLALVAGLYLLASTVSAAQAEPRIALVMGNSNYGKEIGSLPNPVNDATLMAQALTQTGFQVVKVTDADWKTMKRAIQDFGDMLTTAGPQATALFFYAGHGVQVQGANYLIPVGADIGKEADVKIETVSADDVLEQMEFAGSRVNIVILDACRNNPMGRSVRSVSRGLAPMDSVRGTFIAYSTSPGSVAADGTGKNSPYSAALAKTIVRPGVGIEEAFREVRASVMAATGEKQVPWDSSSLTAPFFFKQGSATVAPAPAASATSTIDAEKAVWEAIKDSRQASDYRAYLSQYPSGVYAGLAQNRLAALEQGVSQPVPPKAEEPAAAPAASSKSVPSAPPPSPEPEPASTSRTSDAPAPAKGFEVDSNGVDCRIMDSTRAASDCKRTKRFAPANKPNRG